MIVIATNNGRQYIYSCILNFQQHAAGKWPITIVDTCSSDLTYRAELREICSELGFNFLQCETPNYDFGAYMLAYKSFPDVKHFWFQHDSVTLKNPNFIPALQTKLFKFDIVPWLNFLPSDCFYDSKEQWNWVKENFGGDQYRLGIYGPCFGIKRETLDLLYPELENVQVKNKMHQQGMERGWSVLAEKHKLSISSLEEKTFSSIYFNSNTYLFFDKTKHLAGVPRT